MTSRLFVREVGSTRFEQHNGDFEDDDPTSCTDPLNPVADATKARAEGERLCREGNVEEFQVWNLASQFKRSFNVEPVEVG